MSEMTVKDFAVKVKRDVPRLLEQMKDAGLPHKKEDDAVSEDDKQQLLEHLTKSHGGGPGAKNRITLTRKTKSRIRTGERGKTIEVQVRKKRTYVKRAEEEQPKQPEPKAATGPRQLVGDMKQQILTRLPWVYLFLRDEKQMAYDMLNEVIDELKPAGAVYNGAAGKIAKAIDLIKKG